MRLLSLIVGTLGENRPGLERLLDSLEAQNDHRVELLVVHQGAQAWVRHLCEAHPLARYVTSPRGLSRARNRGLELAEGGVVGFPDDGASYPVDLVSSVLRAFEDGGPGLTGITALVVTPDGRKVFSRMPSKPRWLTRQSVWVQATSIGLFLSTTAVRAAGGFDERLGLGAGTPWAGGEDIDLPIRLLEAGARIRHHPEIHVLHPHGSALDPVERVRKGFDYSMAQGWLLRTHRYPTTTAAAMVARGLGGLLADAARGDRQGVAYRWAVVRGRMQGYLRAGSPTPWDRRAA